jgi:hypothetical protein
MSSLKRSRTEQVRSGFLHAGELVAGLILSGMVLQGSGSLISEASSRHFRGPITAWTELGLATIIIFVTAERSAGFIPGFLFVYAAFKGFSYALIPPREGTNHLSLTQLEWLGCGVYFTVAIVLLWRFIPPRKTSATMLDRVALTVFALSVLIAPALPVHLLLRVPLFGLTALVIAWIPGQSDQRKRRRKQRPADTGDVLSIQ